MKPIVINDQCPMCGQSHYTCTVKNKREIHICDTPGCHTVWMRESSHDIQVRRGVFDHIINIIPLNILP